MKRITIIALLALVTLFAGCQMVQGPEQPAINNGGGMMSQVQITIGDEGRTILPHLDNGFSKFILSAEPAPGNTQNAPEPVVINGYYGTISVPYGDWIFTATAYIEVAGTEYPAAKGSVPLYVDSSSYWITIPINTPEPGGTGTFNYTVDYPSGTWAKIVLTPWPLGQETVINEVISANGVPVAKSVPSGMYFLTVTADLNSKTVYRSEIVHIYHQAATSAHYVFPKTEFGETLYLSGTIKVLVNNVQPDNAYVYLTANATNYSAAIIFNGDGTGTWSCSFNSVGGASTFDLSVHANNDAQYKFLHSMSIPVDDTANIDLGTVELTFNPTPLAPNTWTPGAITANDVADWYSIDVAADTTYYFWWNDAYAGDGSKDSNIDVAIYDTNWNYHTSAGSAWGNPLLFTAPVDGTMLLRVTGWQGTYAIGYSKESGWHSNPFSPTNPVTLTADTWAEGEITTGNVPDWYTIEATAGTIYNVWFNNAYDGDGTTDLYGYITGYSSNGYVLFGRYYAWTDPVPFSVQNAGTVYIRVDGEGHTGTYAIKYSEAGTGPEEGGKDAMVNADFARTGTKVWSMADWVEGRSYIGAPIIQSGSPATEIVNGGINITNRGIDYDTIDIKLIGTYGVPGVVLTDSKYKVTVYGIVLLENSGATPQFGNDGSPYGDVGYPAMLSDEAYPVFKLVLEETPWNLAATGLRVMFGAGNTDPVRITLIEVEEVGQHPACECTGCGLNGWRIGEVGPHGYFCTICDGVNCPHDCYVCKRVGVYYMPPTEDTSIAYIVPTAGENEFYLDLNDCIHFYQPNNETFGRPIVRSSANSVTYTFNYSDQILWIKLNPAQIQALDYGTDITITLTGTADPNSLFRSCLARQTSGSWNLTSWLGGVPGNFPLSTLTGETGLSATNTGFPDVQYFMLQHREIANTDVTIESIKITYTPTVPAIPSCDFCGEITCVCNTLTGGLAAPFQRAGDPVVKITNEGLGILVPSGQSSWGGVDFKFTFQENDVLKITAKSLGIQGSNPPQLMLQVATSGAWADQYVLLEDMTDTERTLIIDDTVLGKITAGSFGGGIRIRFSNPPTPAAMVITSLVVERAASPIFNLSDWIYGQ